ncbi:MAG: hypothetical protein LBO09_05690 [Candidatus Peribacteria bacterium]|nr:hypothetical protein [Candidatus Peribacteria bacterium]
MNSFKTSDEEEYDKEACQILCDMAKEAEKRGFTTLISKHGSEVYWSGEFERPTLEYLEEYKEFILFDELAERLALRDFEKKFKRGPDFRNSEEDYQQFSIIRGMWDDEFEEHGLENLT